jgi:hypothetical protein
MAILAKRTQREWRRALLKARDRTADLEVGPSRIVVP